MEKSIKCSDEVVKKRIIWKLLTCPVNNFPPLLEDDEDEDFEKFLSSLEEEPEEEEDPDEDEFAFNDRFIQDFEDVDDMLWFNNYQCSLDKW